ncbi:tautomerase family protein [Marinomonas mediterranea]|uniref:tautomerase family protein n=1 Tax=Marinomonas mediterranea TaxID=119864 RepID=UPI002348F6D2|nr:tautomerase family protein [Marinomonas mediterranea]WCN11525.1 tautomerase family protein [Marinomonas mediterranea]
MPLVRIYVDQTRSDAETASLSNTLQECLVSDFNVPRDDQFHIIHKLDRTQRTINTSYAMPKGKQRSNDWILIEITGGKPRLKEMKARFYKVAATKISVALNIDPADIMFVLSHNHIEDWSFSHGDIATLPEEA